MSIKKNYLEILKFTTNKILNDPRFFFKSSIVRHFLYKFAIKDIRWKRIVELRKFKNNPEIKKLNLNENSIILDIGANVGNIAIFLYDNYKSYIYCYEPHSKCYSILKQYLKNYKKIRIYKSAISNKKKISKLYFPTTLTKNDISSSSSLDVSKNNIDKNNFIKVKVLNINDVIKKYKKIDLIKIDVEGEEYKILPSLIRNIDKIGIIYCEFHKKSLKQKQMYKKNLKILKNKNLYNKKVFEWI